MDFGLMGKVAVITGGSEGIGKASALRLCEEGADVAICARRPDILQKAADEIKAKTGKEVLAMPVDVCNEAQVQEFVQKTVDRFGGIDILVNNAGGSRAFPFLEASEETWREDIEIKLFGAIFCSKAVIPHMRQRGGGRIINMTTGGGESTRSEVGANVGEPGGGDQSDQIDGHGVRAGKYSGQYDLLGVVEEYAARAALRAAKKGSPRLDVGCVVRGAW